LPWPIGVAVTPIPVAIGILLVRRRATGGLDGPDALRVAIGMVTFFLLLNLFIGLGGRYDMTPVSAGRDAWRAVPSARPGRQRPAEAGCAPARVPCGAAARPSRPATG
jgi:hypothetical protein